MTITARTPRPTHVVAIGSDDAIHGVGQTAEEALEAARDNGATGALTTHPASSALVDRVDARGGAIRYDIVLGVVVLPLHAGTYDPRDLPEVE